MAIASKKIEKLLKDSRVVIKNIQALPEIKEKIDRYGFDEKRIKEGDDLLSKAQAMYNRPMTRSSWRSWGFWPFRKITGARKGKNPSNPRPKRRRRWSIRFREPASISNNLPLPGQFFFSAFFYLTKSGVSDKMIYLKRSADGKKSTDHRYHRPGRFLPGRFFVDQRL